MIIESIGALEENRKRRKGVVNQGCKDIIKIDLHR